MRSQTDDQQASRFDATERRQVDLLLELAVEVAGLEVTEQAATERVFQAEQRVGICHGTLEHADDQGVRPNVCRHSTNQLNGERHLEGPS